MNRTTVMLPSSLKTKAQIFAHKEGVSLGELVREALKSKLSSVITTQDPFFDDETYYECKISSDISINHDQYLYGK